MRQITQKVIEQISPLDAFEEQHKNEVLQWIASGEEIYRITPPDNPPQHLVSYCLLVDPDSRKILLTDHIKAELWLPNGGHVDPNENPKDTAARECFEELKVRPSFLFESPLFLTKTLTQGKTAGHTDVSLWYTMEWNHKTPVEFDPGEFNTIKWFDLDDIPLHRTDPHMSRFLKKLRHALANQA